MRAVRSLWSAACKKHFRIPTFIGLTRVNRVNPGWGKSPALYNGGSLLVLSLPYMLWICNIWLLNFMWTHIIHFILLDPLCAFNSSPLLINNIGRVLKIIKNKQTKFGDKQIFKTSCDTVMVKIHVMDHQEHTRLDPICLECRVLLLQISINVETSWGWAVPSWKNEETKMKKKLNNKKIIETSWGWAVPSSGSARVSSEV